jgi:hypothetical protein
LKPTPAPDPACFADIVTDATCYENGGNIVLSFDNCNPQPDDWIGIYAAGTNVLFEVISASLTWVYSCGDQLCRGSVESGQATLYNVEGEGEFQVYLIQRSNANGGQYVAIAESEAFQISVSCG